VSLKLRELAVSLLAAALLRQEVLERADIERIMYGLDPADERQSTGALWVAAAGQDS